MTVSWPLFSIDVVEYNLNVSGARAVYPNGDLGLLVNSSHPWLGYSVPGGEVRGVWGFYSARDPRWDTITASTDDGQRTTHSPLHPLTVNAFPVETKAAAGPHQTVQLVESIGEEFAPPALPENVFLDVIEEPYTASYAIVSRTETAEYDLADLEAAGFVRGVTDELDESAFREVIVRESNLTLSILNETEHNLTLRVDLHDKAGNPIDTRNREGRLTINDEVVETNASGSVTHTLARGDGGVTARFEPGRWWNESPGYVGDSAVVYARGGGNSLSTVLFELMVPVGLFLLGVFLIDRATQLHVWPPWRRL